MSREPNTWCRVCGAAYFHCTDCERVRSWRTVCDTPAHFQLFLILHEYREAGDASAARTALDHIGFPGADFSVLLPEIQQIINEIIKEK